MTTAQQPAPVPPEPHDQTPQPKSPDQHTVRKQLTSGVFYIAIAKYAGIVISLAVSGVLARLLSPSDFGIVAVATVIITFFSIFSDLGIAPAIIQYKKLTGEELNGIFSFTIWSGLAVSLLFFGSSWLIASYYDSPQLVRICQFLSVNLLFAAMNIVPNALLYKQKRFRFIAMRNLCVQGSVGTIAVIAALSGAGIYALLINPIVSSIVLFIVNLREHPLRVRWTAGLQPLRTIFAFSAYQFSFNVINYFTRNLDKLLIGKYMGMSPLGFYEKSYRLMMLPLQNITNIISPVMHPIFSDFQHDLRKLSESYLKVVRVLAWIGFPLAAVLYFTAPELILLIFGSQWEASVPVFRILALIAFGAAQRRRDLPRYFRIPFARRSSLVHLHFVLGQFRAGLLADVLPHVPPALGSVLAETRFTAAARGPAVEYPVGIRPDITRPGTVLHADRQRRPVPGNLGRLPAADRRIQYPRQALGLVGQIFQALRPCG